MTIYLCIEIYRIIRYNNCRDKKYIRKTLFDKYKIYTLYICCEVHLTWNALLEYKV